MGRNILRTVEIPEENLDIFDSFVELAKGKIITVKLEDLQLENMEQLTEYWVKIVMDEEKILKEDKYDLDEMYKIIDEIAELTDMKKLNKYYYISKNNKATDLGAFTIFSLKRKDWFRENVKDWFRYDKGGEEPKDMIKFFEEDEKKERKKYA